MFALPVLRDRNSHSACIAFPLPPNPFNELDFASVTGQSDWLKFSKSGFYIKKPQFNFFLGSFPFIPHLNFMFEKVIN